MEQSRFLRALKATNPAEESQPEASVPSLPPLSETPLEPPPPPGVPPVPALPEVPRQPAETTSPSSVPGTATPTEVKPTVCPRCGNRLIDPQGLGWCQACGYYHAQAEDRVQAAASAQPKPVALTFLDYARKTPPWVYALLCGVVFIFVTTILVRRIVTLTPFQQALWCTVQLTLGLLIVFFAQLWAMAMVAGDEARLGPQHLLLSGPLWVAAAKRLPETRQPIWLGTWGLALALAALLVVGGMGYWLDALTGPGKMDDKGKETSTRQ